MRYLLILLLTSLSLTCFAEEQSLPSPYDKINPILPENATGWFYNADKIAKLFKQKKSQQ